MMTEEENSNKKQQGLRKTRKKALYSFGLILIVVAILCLVYWFLFIKNYERTENAYVGGNQVLISAQMSSNVTQINADSMNYVQAGEVVAQLDDNDAQLAFLHAQNNLATAVRKVQQLQFSIKQLKALIEIKEISFNKAKGDLARREELNKKGAIDKESLLHAREAAAIAQADLQGVKNQLAASEVLLSPLPLTEQLEVKNAIVNLKQAWLNLQRTKVISPISGYVARRGAQIGQKVMPGTVLMSVVSPQGFWVDANFKETQIKHIRIGQKAKVTFDLYGDDIKFDGIVTGIEMGTGSAFSLLPAQNATGNWIKIVQRVPVRITLDKEQIKKYPLRLGISAQVEIDLSSSKEKQDTLPANNAMETTIFNYDTSKVEQLIQTIIQQNSL